MRTEISKLHKKLNATIIYVTHDQTEAMTMGSKIVLMKDGEIQQIGAPLDLYNNPVNKFVAGFIGSPSMNFIEGKIIKDGNLKFFINDNLSIVLSGQLEKKLNRYHSINVTLGIRPESFLINHNDGQTSFEIAVDVIEPLGNETFLYFTINNNQVIARVNSNININVDDKIKLCPDANKLYFFDEKGCLLDLDKA